MALIIDAPMPKGKCWWEDNGVEHECHLFPCWGNADNCPIIGEIHDKHGDLIDEDEFRQVFYEEMRKHRGNEPIITLIKELLAKADNAPVVLEATE